MQLWSKQHVLTLIPAFILMLILSVVLNRTLGNKSHKIRMIPIQIVAVLLLLLELGKQGLSLYRGYDLYHLPFHFCSMFIFMLPISAFYRGKHRQTIYAITASLCMSVCVLMLIYPELIYGSGNVEAFFTDFFSLHTVAFHNLVMFAALLFPALLVHEPAKGGEWKKVLFFTIGFCVISATMAQLLKTNFNNFYVCNIAPLEVVRQAVENACGKVPAMVMYVVIVTILDILFVQMSYRIYRLVRRFAEQKQKV